MSVFTIADLHLCASGSHSMDVFGSRWRGYTEKIRKNWIAAVKETDTVIIPGDISWAMNLGQAREDFSFLDALPGRKFLGKGNHDFWWETSAKLNHFFEINHFSTLSLLYNNAHIVEDFLICGTRGWFIDESQQNTVGAVDYAKIVNREVQRLTIALEAATQLRNGINEQKEIIVFFHFPPYYNGYECREILDTLERYDIKRCFFGHIHGNYAISQKAKWHDIQFSLISSDFLNFTPYCIL